MSDHTYLRAACDRIAAALKAGDSDTAEAVIRQMAADGHPDVADRTLDRLLAIGAAAGWAASVTPEDFRDEGNHHAP